MAERKMTLTEEWRGFRGLDHRIHATKGRIVAVDDDLLHRYEEAAKKWNDIQDEIARLKSVDYIMLDSVSNYLG